MSLVELVQQKAMSILSKYIFQKSEFRIGLTLIEIY